jgi:hypothetical protein
MNAVDDLCRAVIRKKENHDGGSLFTAAISIIDTPLKGFESYLY